MGYSPTTWLTMIEAAEQITRVHENNYHTWTGQLGVPATVSYAYINHNDDWFQFSEAEVLATEDVLDLWSDVAKITFIPVHGSEQYPNVYSGFGIANINFIDYDDPSPNAGRAHTTGTPGPRAVVDVGFNLDKGAGANFDQGSLDRKSLIHEVGHALGLEHPGDYDADDGKVHQPGYLQDSREFTVMSYFSEKTTGADYYGAYARTPMLHDIAAIQLLYGANFQTRQGQTTYGYHSNADREAFHVYSASENPVFTIWDGGGQDRLDFSGSTSKQTINLAPNSFSSVNGLTNNVAIAGVDDRNLIEDAYGGSGVDWIYGNKADNGLGGNGGSDVLFGYGGEDILNGDDGADTLYGDADYDILRGGAGTDHLHGGTDGIQDALDGGSDDDIYYVDEPEQIFESAHGGFDTVISTATSYRLPEGEEVEKLEFASREAITFSGHGNSIANTIIGGLGNDNLFGYGGSDTLDGGVGADSMWGGVGDDVYHVDIPTDNAIEFGGTAEGIDTVYSTAYSYTLPASVENLVLLDGAVQGVGNDSNNIISGNEYANVLLGGWGEDTLRGGAGADTLIGNEGQDTADYGGAASGVIVDLETQGTWGEADGDTYQSIEIVDGSRFGDHIYGTESADTLNGGAGSDWLEGRSDSDLLIGGSGGDIIQGGEGNDTIYGGFHSLAEATDSDGDDFLYGDGGDDLIVVQWGNDQVHGGDRFGVDTGNDTLSFKDVRTSLTLDLESRSTDYSEYGSTLAATGQVISYWGADFHVTWEGIENLSGGMGGDTITGNALANVLDGWAGSNTLNGGGGDDTFIVDSDGWDTIDGGEHGRQGDTLVITDRTWLLNVFDANVDIEAGTARFSFNVSYGEVRLHWDNPNAGVNFSNIENVTGGARNDILSGSDKSNIIDGGDGTDTLTGRQGNDVLSGGALADTFVYADNWDHDTIRDFVLGEDILDMRQVSGLTSIDQLAITDTPEGARIEVVGHSENSIVLNGVSAASLMASPASFLFGAPLAPQSFDGTAFWDGAIQGGTEIDTVTYATAQSAIYVDLQREGGYAQGLANQIEHLISFENVTGSTQFMNYLHGNEADNVLTGGNNADWLTGRGGNNTLDGKDGVDLADYLETGQSVAVDLTLGLAMHNGTYVDTLSSIENIRATNLADTFIGDDKDNYFHGMNGDDVAHGGAGADQLVGSGDNDTLFGDGGDDLLIGETGGDSMDGGAGFDTASYASSTAGVTVNLGAGYAYGGDADGDHLISIEHVIGSAFNDNLIGGTAAEVLEGGDGNDWLTDGGGADTLLGGAGDDYLYVGKSVATVDGGTGWDAIIADETTDADGLHFNVAGTNVEYVAGHAGNDVIDARGTDYALSISANGGNDTLYAGDGGNTVWAGDGNDIVHGGAGFDNLLGGEGDDVMDGGSAAGAYGDRLYGEGGNDTLTTTANGWALGGAGNDTIYGPGGWLTGDEGNDIIVGGAGTQQIVGGIGDDLMTGGADYDRYDFEAGWGHDVITDFNAEDRIYLAGIEGLSSYAQLAITETAQGAQIGFHEDTILLQGVRATNLTVDLFVF